MSWAQWLQFIIGRGIALLVVLLGLIAITFMMVRLIPGDPAVAVAGIDASPQELATVREQLGLDQPLTSQIARRFGELARGDLGKSFITKEPVTRVIAAKLGSSLQLAVLAVLLVFVLSVPGGIIAAALTREGRHPRTEMAFTASASVGGAIPEFLMATFLVAIFGIWLRLLPVAGDQGWQSLVLPVLALALRPSFVLARIVRLETLNVLAQEYIRTARSKRLPARLIYARHALPNVLTAALTIGGLLFSGLVGSAIVVESIFARPGIGTALVDAVVNRDYPVIQALILLLGATVVVVNAGVDVTLAALDPRSVARET